MARVKSVKNSGGVGERLKGASTLWVLALGALLLGTVGLFMLLSQVSATGTYYVLNQDVPARTQVTAEMLTPVTVSEGGEPRNSLGARYVTNNEVWTIQDLKAGDVLSESVVEKELSSLRVGLPDDFVVTSFEVPPESAVAGTLKRGDYVDIISVSDAGDGVPVAKYVLRRVLIVDVSADLERTNADGVVGVTRLYTVGVPAGDAARLALLYDSPKFLVLSSQSDVDNGSVPADIQADLLELFGVGPVGDSGEGTDPNFVRDREPAATEPPAPVDPDGEGSGGYVSDPDVVDDESADSNG